MPSHALPMGAEGTQNQWEAPPLGLVGGPPCTETATGLVINDDIECEDSLGSDLTGRPSSNLH